MSQEDVEIVKAAIDAVNREDWDAAFKDAAPGFELDMSRGLGLMKGVYGLDQVRPLLTDFARHWEAVRIELHEFIEAGDRLVVPQTTHGEGRDGVEVVSRPTLVWTICDGMVDRVCMYQERQDALEAVGLSEPDEHTHST